MITVAFSTHRLEVLQEAESLMQGHDVIILEEPPQTEFESMLRGEISIDTYLAQADFEFPSFAQACCRLYRRLYAAGKRLLQVEPYMEHLFRLHDFFAAGGDFHELKPDDPAFIVYRVERDATAALLNFYTISLTKPFPEVVQAVLAFARADAARLALRDRMRAGSVMHWVEKAKALYVECGYIHWLFFVELQRLVKSKVRVRPCFLLQDQARHRIQRKQILGPGDRLTLLFVFHPEMTGPDLDRLAAQSLIYIKLLHKDEMVPAVDAYPHLENEAEAWRWTRHLSWNDCQELWPLVRRSSSEEAQEVLTRFSTKER
ncbi:MAG: hypothetical protein WHS46_04950 [Desulfosoma sp.]